MSVWGLVIETTVSSGDRKHVEACVVAHVHGSRAEALAELERRARSYAPEHPRSPRRRRLLREGDGFLLVVDGAWQSFATRFTVAELLEDSAADEPVGQVEEVEDVDDVEKYADGVPVKPAWLGRNDLS
ncbi:hypothetical protein AB0L75_15280 [Streptomyces sp. NPDC052101]|uniref:hypothetical protein n=1 Tax=Streptomyces sp. NPDC052101 TaxID=3155763 RepID=UPI003446E581